MVEPEGCRASHEPISLEFERLVDDAIKVAADRILDRAEDCVLGEDSDDNGNSRNNLEVVAVRSLGDGSSAQMLDELQARVGNLSPRGEVILCSQKIDSSSMDKLNLDPVILVTAQHMMAENSKVFASSKQRGIRAHFPSECTLRSMAR